MRRFRRSSDWVLAAVIVALTGCASNRHLVGQGSAVPVGARAGTARPGQIATTLLLVGDAGHATPTDPVLTQVAAHAAQRPDSTVVVFLGDNLYPDGLAPTATSDRARGEAILRAQARVSDTGARVIFVPGNHDWDGEGPDGWNAVRRAADYVAGFGAETLPRDGCPGPVPVDIGDHLRLVAIDTQWWLHGYDKPGPGSRCASRTEDEVLTALSRAIAEAPDRYAVVVGHHPLQSTGQHAGFFGWKDHVFPMRRLASWLWLPLPIVGSVYPLTRRLNPRDQDFGSARYDHMRDALHGAMRAPRPLVYAAGHEHSLQVMFGRTASYFLVSGTGTLGHHEPVGRLSATRFARAASGFMRLDFTDQHRVRLGVFVVDERGAAREVYSRWLDPR